MRPIQILGRFAGAFPAAAIIVTAIIVWMLIGESAPSDRRPVECVPIAEIPHYETVVPDQQTTCHPITTQP